MINSQIFHIFISLLINQIICVTFLLQPCFQFCEWEAGITPLAQPNLNYLAPEYSLTMTCDRASDMFSMGMMFYTVFNNGKPKYDNCNMFSTFKKNCEKVRLTLFICCSPNWHIRFLKISLIYFWIFVMDIVEVVLIMFCHKVR